MGEFILDHQRQHGRPLFGGAAIDQPAADRDAVATAILPFLRGQVSSTSRVIGHANCSDEAVEFANSRWAEDLCEMGTSCPDHFLRTRISPMFVPWEPARENLDTLKTRITQRVEQYRRDYADYYAAFADTASPARRGSDPSVVVIQGIGLFGFAKDKKEARITAEFFVNAIHVMAGANALEDREDDAPTFWQARHPEQRSGFRSFRNYVALPRGEAFRIEYWALEEAKLQRMPPEREFSRKIALVVGAGSGIGRDVLLQLARKGAHVVAADVNLATAEAAAREAAALSSAESALACELDLTSRRSIRSALEATVRRFGGVDIIVNTAAIYPTPEPGTAAEVVWSQALSINVTSNHVLAQEAAATLKPQGLPASIVLTSSANAVVPKHGSEPYDVSKAAINHLIRELAIGLGPEIRVNGIAPATVVAGSAMFPRDRVIVSLNKYKIAYAADESTEALRAKLADFYAQRTITRRPILPEDCANAICFLAGDLSGRTTGHVIPVDGGLPEAFLR
jgi:NAD(P)-dependent dehydrogenase (short-subunit alcohol dehydrogenase family)